MLHSPSPLLHAANPDPRLSEPIGPLGVILLDVFGPNSPYLTRVLELFWTLFPKYRRYREYIRACSQRHTPEHPHAVGHVWAVYDPAYASVLESTREGTRALENPLGRPELLEGIIGFQIFNYLSPQRGGSGFGLGAFRGLEQGYQHGGVGAWLLRGALEQLALDAQDRSEPPPLGHLVEVEPMRDAKRRESFAQKTGAILLEGEYLEPPMLRGVSYVGPEQLKDIVPKLMQLVFYPAQTEPTLHPPNPLTLPKGSLTLRESCVLLEGIYLDYYRLETDDPLFLHACQSLKTLESRASSPFHPT